MHEKHASAPLPRRAIDSWRRFVAAANSDLLASPPKTARAPPEDVGEPDRLRTRPADSASRFAGILAVFHGSSALAPAWALWQEPARPSEPIWADSQSRSRACC